MHTQICHAFSFNRPMLHRHAAPTGGSHVGGAAAVCADLLRREPAEPGESKWACFSWFLGLENKTSSAGRRRAAQLCGFCWLKAGGLVGATNLNLARVQLGIIVLRNGVAERLSELSSSPVGNWHLAAAGLMHQLAKSRFMALLSGCLSCRPRRRERSCLAAAGQMLSNFCRNSGVAKRLSQLSSLPVHARCKCPFPLLISTAAGMLHCVTSALLLVPWLQEAHIAKLRSNLDTGGDASLQNALDLAVGSLSSIPPYGHRWADG